MPKIDQAAPDISILCVEDELDSREELCKTIRHRYPDVKLYVAENGQKGLKSFKLHPTEVVITDINMPVIDGIKMAREIKALSPTTEIIALTAHSSSNYLLNAIEIGISHYLLKPVDIDQLFKVIDRALAMIRSERIIAIQNREIRDLNAELALKAAELELKNRELESFNYTVAHDLRSHMHSISGFSQVLIDKNAENTDDLSKRYLHIINREVHLLNNLVEALLKFSMHSQKLPEKTWTSLSGIVHEVWDNLLAQEPERTVTLSITEDVNGYCDPHLVWMVLENLLGNAWKYTSKKDDAQVEFGTISSEEDLVYFVRDNGAGFDQKDSDKLFSPFQRLHSDDIFEGFGIGLATAYRIIQRHGGRIWADGEVGKGATFYFTL